MKKIFTIFFILFHTLAFANEAIVITHVAYLLKEPKKDSPILQQLKKNDRVYVPKEIALANSYPEYIETHDFAGNTAYIPSRYIKIITHTLHENKMPISIGEYDPTDYRLEEPLSKKYPFMDNSFQRANISMAVGNYSQDLYQYQSTFTSQGLSYETSIRLTWSHKIVFDNFDRYYFGLYGTIGSNYKKASFQNNFFADEKHSTIKIGPLLSYDLYKSLNNRLTIGTGFTYNFHSSTIDMVDGSNGASEQRLFRGFSLSPLVTSFIQLETPIPAIDFIAGFDLTYHLPHRQTATDLSNLTGNWTNHNHAEIVTPGQSLISLFLGVQSRY